MKYLLDFDWVIDYLKGKSHVIARLSNMVEDGLAMNPITYGEVYEGIYFGRDRAHYMQLFNNFLDGVRLLDLNTAIMQEFACLRGNLRSQGMLIGDFDLLIAATALHHNLILLTNNRTHFQRIPGLTLITTS
jgi:predicted nucleic acid-binding protein